MSTDIVTDIYIIANVRKIVDQSFEEQHIYDGTYFDVFEGIKLAGEEYSEYSIVFRLTQKQYEFVLSAVDFKDIKYVWL